MEKVELIKIIKKLLITDVDLDFLLELDNYKLEILVACIRDRLSVNNK